MVSAFRFLTSSFFLSSSVFSLFSFSGFLVFLEGFFLFFLPLSPRSLPVFFSSFPPLPFSSFPPLPFFLSFCDFFLSCVASLRWISYYILLAPPCLR